MSIFRAYDIRGVFGKDLTEEVAGDVGKAFGTYSEGGDIVVGWDCRLSSEALRDSLVKGLTSAGCDVTDIGMVPTPVLYFAITHYGKDGGIMITGSHNPPGYNGFKLCRGDKTLYGEEIQKLKNMIEAGAFIQGEGKVTEKNVTGDYINFVRERIRPKRRLGVVIDSGNGTAGEISARLFEKLGCRVSKINWRPDGNFPNHFPDPTVDEFLTELIRRVKIERADFGIAYDGDADRLGIVDDKGNIIRGDQILMLFAREILKHGTEKIIFEVKCSQALMEDIRENGGIPIMYRTGHSFIKKKMREEGAVLAGEMSGHFFFADNYYGYDDGIFASARMAELLSNSDEKLSEMVEKMPHYHSTPEIRVHCPEEEKFKIVEEVTKRFQEKYDVITVDGARVQFRYGWGLVRASNTEPALILRFEAKTEEKLDEIKNIILDELREFPAVAENLPGE